MSRTALAQTARALLACGLRPVPMIAAAKRPALKGWRERASLDPEVVARAFAEAPGADAIAIATGEGVFVVDIDRGHAAGADGIAAFAAVARQHAPLPKGPRTGTPSGGSHLYFAAPPGGRIANRCGVLTGVDVRGDGGLALCAPSALTDGRAWCWSTAPWELEIPPAPDWLLALVNPPKPQRAASAPLRPFVGQVSAYACASFERECEAVANAPRGTRNATLYAAARKLGSLAAAGALSAESVASSLFAAAETCGLVAEDGEHAADATIASGLNWGRAHPRALPEGKARP